MDIHNIPKEPKFGVTRIISGGQAGSDAAGLIAARGWLGIETGGFAPKGFRTEVGNRPRLKEWGLVEMNTKAYAPRTRANVEACDAVVIYSVKPESPGTKLTIKVADQCRKPWILINPTDSSAISKTRNFLEGCCPMVLMIAGNRESVYHGITVRVIDILVKAFTDQVKKH